MFVVIIIRVAWFFFSRAASAKCVNYVGWFFGCATHRNVFCSEHCACATWARFAVHYHFRRKKKWLLAIDWRALSIPNLTIFEASARQLTDFGCYKAIAANARVACKRCRVDRSSGEMKSGHSTYGVGTSFFRTHTFVSWRSIAAARTDTENGAPTTVGYMWSLIGFVCSLRMHIADARKHPNNIRSCHFPCMPRNDETRRQKIKKKKSILKKTVCSIIHTNCEWKFALFWIAIKHRPRAARFEWAGDIIWIVYFKFNAVCSVARTPNEFSWISVVVGRDAFTSFASILSCHKSGLATLQLADGIAKPANDTFIEKKK